MITEKWLKGFSSFWRNVNVITGVFFGIFQELEIVYVTLLFKLRSLSFQDDPIQGMLLTQISLLINLAPAVDQRNYSFPYSFLHAFFFSSISTKVTEAASFSCTAEREVKHLKNQVKAVRCRNCKVVLRCLGVEGSDLCKT